MCICSWSRSKCTTDVDTYINTKCLACADMQFKAPFYAAMSLAPPIAASGPVGRQDSITKLL